MATYKSKYTGEQIDKAVGDVLNGNVGSGGATETVELDATLTQAGKAADAKATGERLTALSEEIEQLKDPGETITKTGVIVSIDADAGAEIKVEADTAETVTLYHSGINVLPNFAIEKTQNGVTSVLNPNGKVTFSGAPSSTAWFDVVPKANPIYIPAGKYKLVSFDLPAANNGYPIVFTIEATNGETVIDGTGALSITPHDNGIKAFELSKGIFVNAYYTVNTAYDGTKVTCGVMLCRSVDVTSQSQYIIPNANKSEVALPAEIDAHDGINVLYVESGEELTVSTKVAKDGTVDEDAVNAIIEEALRFDATQYGVPVLTLDGDCTGMTKDDYVSLAFTFTDKDGNALSGNADVKKQGSSSIQTGIEIGKDFDTDLGGLFNFTIKFPESFEAKAGWTAQKKYCFKANAIDHSHARNVCSCKLWGEIVKSRANVPTELSGLVNGGAIDGFPIVIVLNGKFYALGTLNIPKDGWMFGSPHNQFNFRK